MRAEPGLTGRSREILHTVVRTYIQTGEPVGSRTISKLRNEDLSPASIRNTMADLADEGYLSQPHTSAGRIPTEKAFREYVASLTARRMPLADAGLIRDQLQSAITLEDRIERSSHILTALTRNVGIAAALPGDGQELDQIELMRLSGRQVLMILVTRDGLVRNRVLVLDEVLSGDELTSIRNYVNHNFSGWLLPNARRELLRRIEEERAAYDEVLRKLAVLYGKGLLEVERPAEVHLEGVSNLISIDLHLTHETMRDLMRALEEKERLLELLDRFLEQPSGELTVHVGLGDAHPAMTDLALIGVRVQLPSGLAAKIAVLGPIRMHYERVMSAVLHIGQTFQITAQDIG